MQHTEQHPAGMDTGTSSQEKQGSSAPLGCAEVDAGEGLLQGSRAVQSHLQCFWDLEAAGTFLVSHSSVTFC